METEHPCQTPVTQKGAELCGSGSLNATARPDLVDWSGPNLVIMSRPMVP